MRVQKELTAQQIRDLVGVNDPTILEIGCNDGTDTLKFLEAMPNATIHCFEPDPRAIARFKEIVGDNPQVSFNPTALSNYTGQANFYGSSGRPPDTSRKAGAPDCCWLPEWDLSGSLCTPTGHLKRCPWVIFPEDRVYEVEVITLDDWLYFHGEILRIDFIWMDVQGAEALVLQGATRALEITRFLYTEFSDTPLYEGQVCLKELQEVLPDFESLGVYGENILLENKQE